MKIERLLPLVILVLTACGSAVEFSGGDADAGDVAADHATDVPADVPADGEPDGGGDPPGDPGPDVHTDGGPSECGNGETESGEACDDGNDVDGDGCDNDCTWTCERNWECADEDFCTSDVCDVPTHTCSHASIDCSDTDDCTVDGCDPASGCTHERLPDWYRDEDDDGHGLFSDRVCAESAPEGYVASSDDCCDIYFDVNPGVTGWFSEGYYCGSTFSGYDYDCSGTAERRWWALGSCAHSGGGCVATVGWESSSWVPTCGYTWDWIGSCFMDSSTGACLPATTERTQQCH